MCTRVVAQSVKVVTNCGTCWNQRDDLDLRGQEWRAGRAEHQQVQFWTPTLRIPFTRWLHWSTRAGINDYLRISLTVPSSASFVSESWCGDCSCSRCRISLKVNLATAVPAGSSWGRRAKAGRAAGACGAIAAALPRCQYAATEDSSLAVCGTASYRGAGTLFDLSEIMFSLPTQR